MSNVIPGSSSADLNLVETGLAIPMEGFNSKFSDGQPDQQTSDNDWRVQWMIRNTNKKDENISQIVNHVNDYDFLP